MTPAVQSSVPLIHTTMLCWSLIQPAIKAIMRMTVSGRQLWVRQRMSRRYCVGMFGGIKCSKEEGKPSLFPRLLPPPLSSHTSPFFLSSLTCLNLLSFFLFGGLKSKSNLHALKDWWLGRSTTNQTYMHWRIDGWVGAPQIKLTSTEALMAG